MSELNKQSRLNKFEKRRSNTKKISILMIIASILIIILLAIWIFGGKDEDTSPTSTDSPQNENMELNEDVKSDDEDSTNSEKNKVDNDQQNEDAEDEELEINEVEEVETEQVQPSDDNVIEAYTGNWQPIGTEQEGTHTTTFADGSQDRIEIKQAVMSVTGLGEELTEHWVGNDGPEKVVATVSNKDNTEIYRVYLSWVDQQGWQVTQVERLKEI